jgi:hypothetical protein
MAPANAKLLCCASLVIAASAFRVRPKKKRDATMRVVQHEQHEQRDPVPAMDGPEPMMLGPASTSTTRVGEPGQVDFIFNFGAPGGGSPALQNQRGSSPCFPGLRVWQTEPGTLWGKWLDLVTRIANAASYWHAYMDAMEQDTKKNRHWNYSCSSSLTRKPNDALSTSISLHDSDLYIRTLESRLSDPFFHNMSIFAGRKSYMRDIDTVYQQVKQYGWGLVGTSFHSGGSVYGGAQVSHLIQEPSSLECSLTFQGTKSLQGWMENFNVPAKAFCGLTYEDESCGTMFSTCTTRRPRGSFVHGGFKDRIMAMIKSSDFQNNIKPYLSSCSRVYAVGHSLGGVVAELFAACASRAPKPGEYGYEDYRHMEWTRGSAAKLQYVGE